ncbi:MAG TPA: SPFH domain-containing protein, partial [Cyclobacteriaceae bacterium]|nr:SPFH domain-containing protein [Cyclobacteriaceae bacterium]
MNNKLNQREVYMEGMTTYLSVIITFVVIILASSIRILREYERAVVFRLGRLIDTKGPGIILLIPIVDRMVRVSLRTVVMDVPEQ